MDGLAVVGTVPDEVLLACGRPTSVPSHWWTPSLVGRPDSEVARLRSSACALLDDLGVRDGSGRLTGALGAVADVVARATVLLLLETDQPGGTSERRSVVAAADRALLLGHGDGVHDLLLAEPAVATMLLADLLAGERARLADAPLAALDGVGTPAAVAAVLPEQDRLATTRITRTAIDGPEPLHHLVTVVEHRHGTVACWALPDGLVHVQVLDDPAAVADLAITLLGATCAPDVPPTGVVA